MTPKINGQCHRNKYFISGFPNNNAFMYNLLVLVKRLFLNRKTIEIELATMTTPSTIVLFWQKQNTPFPQIKFGKDVIEGIVIPLSMSPVWLSEK